ncbi:MAG: hypothetical protein QOI76_17 [Frankiales bacterium]|jgi:hypothetical protein|nr:hypothetical protein [Frankiales bacterium]
MQRMVIALIMAVVVAACGRAAPTPESSPSAASVHGTVLASPSCPVERVDSPCPPMPVRDADVVASLNGAVVAHTRSATDGSFELALPGGSFTLTATTNGGYRQSASQAVLVPDAGAIKVTITLDSGIR